VVSGAAYDAWAQGGRRNLWIGVAQELLAGLPGDTQPLPPAEADLLGEVADGGNYENLAKETETILVFAVDCLCVTLDALIHLERAAGRRKDLEAIAELEAIREEREKTGLR